MLGYDAVLTEDMKPIQKDTPENLRAWLKENPLSDSYSVCIGSTMRLVSVSTYLEMK